jgi:hypothetical protein
MKTRTVLTGGLALIAVIVVAAWAGRDLYQTARIGTAYVAKQTCSCRFVAERSEASCKTDYEADAIKPLTVQPAASNSISVSAMGGWIKARAEFEQGFGCHVVN